eukprot:501902-Hanusia_phi.AAC.1
MIYDDLFPEPPRVSQGTIERGLSARGYDRITAQCRVRRLVLWRSSKSSGSREEQRRKAGLREEQRKQARGAAANARRRAEADHSTDFETLHRS